MSENYRKNYKVFESDEWAEFCSEVLRFIRSITLDRGNGYTWTEQGRIMDVYTCHGVVSVFINARDALGRRIVNCVTDGPAWVAGHGYCCSFQYYVPDTGDGGRNIAPQYAKLLTTYLKTNLKQQHS